MAGQITNIARNDLVRAFIFESRGKKCCEKPIYVPCLAVDSLDQSAGDVTRLECPDPFNYGKYIEVDTIPGEIERMTTTLTTRMSRTDLSLFRSLFTRGCSFDLHLHFGLCSRPNAFNEYDKAIVFENVQVTSYGTDPIIALTSGDRAEINETVDISIGNMYEIVPLTYAERDDAGFTAFGEVIDALYLDYATCGGECGDPSDGCQQMFVITAAGTVRYTEDGTITWTNTTQPLGVATTTGIDYLDGQLWAYNSTGEIRYIKAEALKDGSTPCVVTGLPTLGVDQDSGLTYGLVVGTDGFVGYVTSPSQGFEETFTLTTEDFVEVNFTRDCALLGGTNGTLFFTSDGLSFEEITTPTELAAVTISAVLIKDGDNWLIGGENGQLWCTDNHGDTWTRVTLPCDLTVGIVDIESCDGRIIWLVESDNTLWKSTDYGCTWVLQPESGRAYPVTDAINGVTPCCDDLNQVTTWGASFVHGMPRAGTGTSLGC